MTRISVILFPFTTISEVQNITFTYQCFEKYSKEPHELPEEVLICFEKTHITKMSVLIILSEKFL